MNIALDVRYKMESGSSSYIKNVVPRILERDSVNRYLLIKYPSQHFKFESSVADVVLSPERTDAQSLLWTLTALPVILKRRHVDLYHAMKLPGPLWNPARVVLTMHSIFRPYKGSFPVNLKSRIFLALVGEHRVKHADHVIAVSEFVKECVVDQYHVDDARIDVIYHGVADWFRPLDAPLRDETLNRRGLRPGYILCVGNVTPVKNHVTAVRSLAHPATPADATLVIAGGTDDPYFDLVRKEAEKLAVSDRVVFLGFVRGEELVAVMNGAHVLLFPSLTEGCPVTMLEAFSCGLPVVASRRGGLWDVGRDRALFVDDPMDAGAFANHVARLYSSAALHAELSATSLERASQFSWEISAERHLDAYARAVGADLHR